jgi:hypothetical protein
MARGKQVYLSYTALVLLSLTTYTTADLWSVDIDLGPAPSPEDGPPFSAHASRDRSLLPYQVVGIVGSYVGSAIIIVTLLLTVGRSRRRLALDRAAEARCTEMVKPMNRAFDPSPISPVSSRSWYSPRKLKPKKSSGGSMRSGGMSSPISPTGASVISFDAAVVEADKQKRQEEMERLYAAVMAQDERRSQQQAISPPLPPPPPIPSGSPPEYSRKKPPRLITNAPNLKHLQSTSAQYPTSPSSPSTPKSPIRAIYPPGGPTPPMPSGPTSPLRAAYPSNAISPVYQPYQDALYVNRGRSASDSSQRSSKRFRKSLKNIKISSPIVDDNSDGARTHLYRRASTQTQAFRQTHRQLAQPIQRTARHTRLPHQAQAAPGATAMTSRVKSSKKSSTIKSAPSHNQTLSARLHVSTNLQQLPHHHPAQQVSPRLSPSAIR